MMRSFLHIGPTDRKGPRAGESAAEALAKRMGPLAAEAVSFDASGGMCYLPAVSGQDLPPDGKVSV
jgi:hypothetical protein